MPLLDKLSRCAFQVILKACTVSKGIRMYRQQWGAFSLTVLAMILAMAAWHPVWAQGTSMQGAPDASDQRVALVIGNNKYEFVDPLKNKMVERPLYFSFKIVTAAKAWV